jgi:hypothetical protein
VLREREVRGSDAGCGVPEYRRSARSPSEPEVAELPVDDAPTTRRSLNGRVEAQTGPVFMVGMIANASIRDRERSRAVLEIVSWNIAVIER